MHLRLFLLALTLLPIGSCARPPDPQVSQGYVLWMTAASTAESASEVAERFEASTPFRARISLGASSALATQLLAGAPGDVFLSASVDWTEALDEVNLVEQSVPLLSNELVLLVAEGNPMAIGSPADLLGAQVRRVALAGEHVPAGRYARQALGAAGVYDQLVSGGRIVRGHDVRRALAFVEAGEADAAVGYATDALVARRTQVAYRFPASDHDPIVYPLVLLRTAGANEAALQMFEFLRGPEAREVFESHGFRVLAPARQASDGTE